MFLKIMGTENKADSDSSKGHKLIECVQYEFFKDPKGAHCVDYKRKDGFELVEEISSNVYVLNENGKTINSFHLPLV